MDAYLEEELYDLLTFSIQNSKSPDLQSKRSRVQEIGKELYADGGIDALENMFFAIEHRIKDEIGADARTYRSWWNGVSADWNY